MVGSQVEHLLVIEPTRIVWPIRTAHFSLMFGLVYNLENSLCTALKLSSMIIYAIRPWHLSVDVEILHSNITRQMEDRLITITVLKSTLIIKFGT